MAKITVPHVQVQSLDMAMYLPIAAHEWDRITAAWMSESRRLDGPAFIMVEDLDGAEAIIDLNHVSSLILMTQEVINRQREREAEDKRVATLDGD